MLKAAEGPYNNMAYQINEKVLAAISLFHYTLVNGDATTSTTEFDGLDKMLAGTSTEYNTGVGSAIDVSTMVDWFREHDGYEVIELRADESTQKEDAPAETE